MAGIVFSSSQVSPEIPLRRGDLLIYLIDSLDLESTDDDMTDQVLHHLIRSTLQNVPSVENILSEMSRELKVVLHSSRSRRRGKYKELLEMIVGKVFSSRFHKVIVTFSKRESIGTILNTLTTDTGILVYVTHEIKSEVVSKYHTGEELLLQAVDIPINREIIEKALKEDTEVLVTDGKRTLVTNNLSYFDRSPLKSYRMNDSVITVHINFAEDQRERIVHFLQKTDPLEVVLTHRTGILILDARQYPIVKSGLGDYIGQEQRGGTHIIVVGKSEGLIEAMGELLNVEHYQLRPGGLSLTCPSLPMNTLQGLLTFNINGSTAQLLSEVESLLKETKECVVVSGANNPRFFPTRFNYRNGILKIEPPLIFYNDLRPMFEEKEVSIVLSGEDLLLDISGEVEFSDDLIIESEGGSEQEFAFYQKRLQVTMRISRIEYSTSDGQKGVFHR